MPRKNGFGPCGMGAMTGRNKNGCLQNGQDFNKKSFLETQEAKLENQLKLVKEQLLSLNNSAQ